ncbi:glycosyl hydrolase [Neorhodopirellula pilleata]|uniref:F5/8 type C domain protein n=1 Tax=Neorhodopirellula pilleata TaxID=2714738 RepID=A0A5C6AUE9_9BACT|nr:glycosyl hydrolase [Neorhodopirellula pilleata]TWU03097.1 F5/8 type C domain protein [Neorhodopirellula pilleata]
MTHSLRADREVLCSIVLITCWFVLPPARADELADGFRRPPHDAGIRAFWWWLNGNVNKESITRDLEQMKAKGFNGALIFDADGSSQGKNSRVPAGPTFGSQPWTELFGHACREANRLDLELSLNIQSGWNLGGPDVTAEEATQTLVWSEIVVRGPSEVQQVLPQPKKREFYQDVTVLAFPKPQFANEEGAPSDRILCELEATSTSENSDAEYAMDGDFNTYWVSDGSPRPESPQSLLLKLSEKTKVSKLSLQGRKRFGPRCCFIELSDDNQTYVTVHEATLKDGQRLEANFKPRNARFIRLLFTEAYDPKPINGFARNVQVVEVSLPDIAVGDDVLKRPISDLALKSATQELGKSAPDCRFLLENVPVIPEESVIRPAEIVELSAKMAANGMLRWQAPQGDWVVLRIGHTNTGAQVSTHSEGWDGRVLDYMNPASLDAYWDRQVEPLLAAIGPLAGKTLRYVHTDSWEGGGMNWSPGFDRTFYQRRGYDPKPWLAVLAGYVVDSRVSSNAFLADFRKTIGDRIGDHYGQLSRLAERCGMATHPECSGPHAGPLDGLKNYGRSEIMMSEFWSPSPHRPDATERFFVKQAASAAHTYGKRLVGAEGFTTIGPHWNDVPWSSMKPSFDHEFCSGLNLLFNHTFTCSPREMGLPGQEYFAGTHFNPQVTWWNESFAIIDYFRRCQYLAQQGDFVADVVYYYGDHIPNIATLKESDPAGALPDFDYDTLSEELLTSSLTVNESGMLSLPSGMQYRVLVLPDHRVLSLGALIAIDKLVRAGGTVIGPRPERAVSLEGGEVGRARFQELASDLWGNHHQADQSSGSRNVGDGRVAWGITARDWLHQNGISSDVKFAPSCGTETTKSDKFNWIHYRIGDVDIYFVSEPNGKEVQGQATFRCEGKIPEFWDAVDGSIRQASEFRSVAGGTEVPMKLDPFGSLFVVFRQLFKNRQTTSIKTDHPNFPARQPLQSIKGPWFVSFEDRWGGPSQPIRFDELTSWTDHQDPRVKYYSGKAVYQTNFFVNEHFADKDLAIELGSVKDVGIARVHLNGTDLGIVWRPPFQVRVRDAVKQGENQLQIEVVNSWRNRLIGDRTLPPNERVTRTNIHVHKNWRLEPSGLLGPVQITTSSTE